MFIPMVASFANSLTQRIRELVAPKRPAFGYIALRDEPRTSKSFNQQQHHHMHRAALDF